MAALVSAWTLLKNRGQELDLPPPAMPIPDGYMPHPGEIGVSPQDLTDRRVDFNHAKVRALQDFHDIDNQLTSTSPRVEHVSPYRLGYPPKDPFMAQARLNDGEYTQHGSDAELEAMQSKINLAHSRTGREDEYEEAQRKLDQQTMTRMGQQGEADEMDAMGVPEMGRTLSERPRMPPVGADDLHPDDLDEMSDEEVGAYTDEVEARGPTNPFPYRHDPDQVVPLNPNYDGQKEERRASKLANTQTMKSLDAAWSLLKALPEQQMGYDDEGMQWNRTMHPAIQGMVARAGEAGRTPSPYDFSAVGGDSDAYIQNLPGHPAEFRNNPKEEGESFRREPHQYPKEGQRVASPEEMKRVDSKNLESLFMEDGDEDYTELLPETYKERNARIWQEHQARENAPFVEPAPRYGRGGSGKEYKSIGEYPYDPAETAFTALKDIQQAKHPLGDD